MYLFSIMLLCQFSLGLPTDTVIQIRQWGVVGGERVLEQVLVNGVNLTNRNDEINKIIRTILGDAPTRRQAFDLHTEVSEAAMSKNHTLLRVRECIVDGSSLSVQLSDRILCNGKVYLTLDRTTDTRLAPKRLRDKNPVSTGNERGQLQEGCIHLMQELKLSQAKSGFRHPGGVIGSIIHYPQNITEIPQERKGNGYQAI
ncbi:uncharacterized protein LOC130124180 isoform X2 [Lampris incognitus]|uniref:uncharacterized protein LOC130124180 isoform X2 n=1 Tax=Lampris incognitus TaxID=2546036 RepID=UPI0024B528C6|nr:uncharacterized protein LOC130124180 isoform X2 [Lampris incognitus]